MSTLGSSPGTTTFVLNAPYPPLDDLAPERDDVVVRGELRRPGHLERARARRAAMRPVHRDRLARRPAEELVDGDAERLGLEVEQRVLDPGDRLRDDRARALPGGAVEIPVDRLDRSRIAPDDERREILDDAGEPARRAVRVGDLGPADEPVVRRRLEEDPGAPAGVAVERLERGDLHAAGGYGAPSDLGQRRLPARDEPLRALPVLLVVDVEALEPAREERREHLALARPVSDDDARPRDLERAVLDVDLGQGLVLARVPGDVEVRTGRAAGSSCGRRRRRATSSPGAASRARPRGSSRPRASPGAARDRAARHRGRGTDWSRGRARTGRTARRGARACTRATRCRVTSTSRTRRGGERERRRRTSGRRRRSPPSRSRRRRARSSRSGAPSRSRRRASGCPASGRTFLCGTRSEPERAGTNATAECPLTEVRRRLRAR